MKEDPYKKREARKYDNPIASREFILDLIASHGAPMSFKRLAKTLELEAPAQRDALRNRLGAMVRDGQLVSDRRNQFALATKNVELIVGKVTAHPDGYGFLVREGDEEDVFLNAREMRQVIHGDRVSVRLRSRRNGKSEGEIVEVLERNTQQLVGRFYLENDLGFIEPLNNRVNHEVLIRNSAGFDLQVGHILVVDVVEQPRRHGVVVGEVLEVLGTHLTPNIEVEVALRNHDIPSEWPEDVIADVDAMPIQVRPHDKRNRFDLTEIPFVTIDGADARDFDDAVYCEPIGSGRWRLYVAIADVGHYVDTGSPLDLSARSRGTSVYFPQYVVPMLPEKLSNGLCSLNPKVDRLVMVCEMIISAQGKVTSYQFYEGVLYSHARLTYNQVAEALAGEEGVVDEALLPNLEDLKGLYEVLSKSRAQRGAIEFESTEVTFQFSEEGRVQGINPVSRNTAHRIIEECMLCANVCAAKFINKHKKPGLFRVHEPPEAEKLEFLKEFLGRFGVDFSYSDRVTPADYQHVVEQLRGKKNGHILQMQLLRSMNQAVYQVENQGHFGLGFQEYTHFTSPIRRYPDLLTHRLIKSVIHSNLQTNNVARLGRPKKQSFFPYDLEQMIALGEHTSFTERRAESAVYEVLEWIKCDYISDRVGDVVEGVITAVTKFGFFVELTNIYVEGLVHVSSLTSDYYRFDQVTQCLTGERNHVTYGMGDLVQVQIARVNVDERKIDFEVVSHTPLVKKSPGRSVRKRKASSGQKSAGTAHSGVRSGERSGENTNSSKKSRSNNRNSKRQKRNTRRRR